MFTDTEAGMAVGFGARLRQESDYAQALIDQVHGQKVAAERRAVAAERRAATAEADVEALKEALAKVTQALSLEKADLAGVGAQLDAMIAQHPDSPLREKVVKRVGVTESRLRGIFREAFDASLIKAGFKNPERYRA